MSWLLNLYRNSVLAFPKVTLILAACIVLLLAQGASRFELDASAEALVLEGDKDLLNYRQVTERFGSSDFLVVTYNPPWPLFSEASLSLLKQLRDELKVLPRVASIYSLLDVPLLENPRVNVTELIDNIKTLEHPDVDIETAKIELSTSPIYDKMLLNLEKNTSAIQINRPFDHRHHELTNAREALWALRKTADLTTEESEGLQTLNQSIEDLNAHNAAILHQDIEQIRKILKPYQQQAIIHLGGVPMIADDMISFVESDMYVFGVGVFLFLVLVLAVIFRRVRWVVIALTCKRIMPNNIL